MVDVAGKVSVNLRLREDDWEAFKKFVVETHGQKYGYLGEEASNALSEYADHDRVARMEERQREILARLDELDGSHTHTQNDTVSEVNHIADQLAQTDRTVIKTATVEREIEKRRGSDDRTLDKWKDKLKRWGAAYKHPSDEVWTLDRETWVEWATDYVNNNPTVNRGDVIEGYPVEWDEFERLATEVAEA